MVMDTCIEKVDNFVLSGPSVKYISGNDNNGWFLDLDVRQLPIKNCTGIWNGHIHPMVDYLPPKLQALRAFELGRPNGTEIDISGTSWQYPERKKLGRERKK
jgi:hypothetical protein